MTTLLLVRHGETDWNAEGRLQGHTDTLLNDYGRRQAAALGEDLAGDGIDVVYSSDLARARETAEIVAGRLGLPVVLEPGLREKNWGSWEGLTPMERDATEYVGESNEAHRERTLRTLGAIAERHPGRPRPRGHPRRLDTAGPGGSDRHGVPRHGELRPLGRGPRGRFVQAVRLTRPETEAAPVEDYTSKYKGEQVEVALFGGEYQEGVLTAYCYVDEVAHIELNGHILVPLQNIASLHCSSRCDAPQNEDWPPRGLLDDDGRDEQDDGDEP